MPRTAAARSSSTPWAASTWTRSTIRLRGARSRAYRLCASRRRRRHRRRFPWRGDQRKAGDGIFLRRPRQARPSAPIPTCRRSTSVSFPAGTAFVTDAWHDRRFRFGDRHGQGRAAAALRATHLGGPLRAGGRPGDVCAVAVETDPATGLATKVGAVRLGGSLEQAVPTFWELTLRVDLYFHGGQSYDKASLRGALRRSNPAFVAADWIASLRSQ